MLSKYQTHSSVNTYISLFVKRIKSALINKRLEKICTVSMQKMKHDRSKILGA